MPGLSSTPPIRPSGEEFQDFCTMLGLMTFTWAWAENTLAMTIGIIVEKTGPISGHRIAPLSLKGEVACFRNALRDITALKPATRGQSYCGTLRKPWHASQSIRSQCRLADEKGGFEGVSIGMTAGRYAVKNYRANIGDAVLLNAEIAKLQDDAAAFMLKVVAILDSGTPRPPRKRGLVAPACPAHTTSWRAFVI